MSKKISILSTAAIGNGMVELAKENGIELDIVPFIDVAHVEEMGLADKVSELGGEDLTAVFTSKHGVESVARMLKGEKANWSIYCLGNKTKSVVNQHFSNNKIANIEGNSDELAGRLIADGVRHIVYFCGDKRLDILPDRLKNAGIDVAEYVVYRTHETPKVIDKDYDGVLFFSPSAVDSFFKANTIKEDVIFFAVGSTTANAIIARSMNKILISGTATKEQVVTDAVNYFK